MPDTITSLLDPAAFAIVLAGTVLACAARCGWHAFGAALRAATRLLRRGLDSEANRRALALAITAIAREGAHRADPALPPDHALGLMLETFLRYGTVESLGDARSAQRVRHQARHAEAAQVFAWAGELAPVFGMIGTLYGLTQLAPVEAASPSLAIMGAVSTAVLTSLYGALLAHRVCFRQEGLWP
jgi:chemotaxis protein MotA